MYLLAKALLASVLGAATMATLEASPIGAALIATLSVLMWISVLTDALRLMRALGI